MTLEQKTVLSFPSPYYLLYLETLTTIQPFPNSQEKNIGKCGSLGPALQGAGFLESGERQLREETNHLLPKQEAMFGQLVKVFPYLPPVPPSSSVLLYMFLIIKIISFQNKKVP